MRRKSKMIALGMVTSIVLGTVLTGCGKKEESTEEGRTNYTWMIDKEQDSRFYENYQDGPVQQYWMNMDWDADKDGEGKKISVEFTAPTAGSEQDYVNTLLATGEYPDVMSLNFSSESAAQLYDEGIAIDLTDYIEQYMPNYKAWIKSHPGYDTRLSNNVDGERKYIQLYNLCDQENEPWGGFIYRRDWIVKYGKNPTTGAAFTGGYDADGNWTDDVVFPSGGTDPVYISDWEWMFDIFEMALKGEKINDGYAFSQSYCGYVMTGDGIGGFNTNATLYMDDGVAKYGANSDNFRAYVECMKKWYEQGWMDQKFEEHASDMFYMVDSAKVYSGKVGMWWGTGSQLADRMDTSKGDTSNPLHGTYMAAAAQPINDIYGGEDAKGKDPVVFYSGGMATSGIILTNKVEDKDIPTLLTAIDYLYSTEGGLLRGLGFSDKQQEEIQCDLYKKYDLECGYFVGTEGDTSTYTINTKRELEDGLVEASTAQRLVGININNMDHGYSQNVQSCMEQWKKYTISGSITSDLTSQIPADMAQENSTISANINTYLAQAVPEFITGKRNIDSDEDWKDFCDTIEEYGSHTIENNYNEALGNKQQVAV